ncbi:MAG: nucleoside hydrolase [Lachnospiraceae bacterium]|jgi:pyrimidine-specific ribonucleoside hydrolase|nr:nucleoside hydrolase [Lachnospiraceae bacterium]
MRKIPVIIDCDPGHDDMMALVLAYGSKALDIRAVTTVAGNNTLDNTTRNALNVLHYIGADEVPVGRGTKNPIVRDHQERIAQLYAMRRKWKMTPAAGEKEQEPKKQVTGASAHGVSGLDGFTFPEENPKREASMGAVELMAKVLRESEEKVTIIPTGPLTNIGLLVRAFPDLLCKIERISMMGGTSEFVLNRPFMEFNTLLDPEATKIVFESGVPIIMFGYDVTYRVLYDTETIRRIEAIGNDTGRMVTALLKYFMASHNSSLSHLNLKDVAPIHDACAVAGVIDPTLVTESKMLHVDIETAGTYFDGATVCDYTGCLKLPANVEVVYNMDTPRFLDLLVKASENCK